MTQGQHRATARVLDILESLSGSEEGLTLTELSQALDAPKSSLFPIVHTLEERRYLRQDDGTGRYTRVPGRWCWERPSRRTGGWHPLPR